MGRRSPGVGPGRYLTQQLEQELGSVASYEFVSAVTATLSAPAEEGKPTRPVAVMADLDAVGRRTGGSLELVEDRHRFDEGEAAVLEPVAGAVDVHPTERKVAVDGAAVSAGMAGPGVWVHP